jgi:thioredoxin
MQKRVFFIILMLTIMLPMVAQEVIYLTTEQFKERIFDYTKEKDWKYKGDKPCVIDFYATWCGPCKRLAPIMDTLSHIYKDQVVFYKVDTDRERELAYVFQISSIPQVLYVPMEGKPWLLKGLYPQENIEEIIQTYLCK